MKIWVELAAVAEEAAPAADIAQEQQAAVIGLIAQEAVEIFWNNIDKYWYTDLSTDEVFVNAFNDTAKTIMHVSTTNKDILKWVLIVIAIILLGIIIINLVKQKNQRAREKAEEDQRILNTPIDAMAQDQINKMQKVSL